MPKTEEEIAKEAEIAAEEVVKSEEELEKQVQEKFAAMDNDSPTPDIPAASDSDGDTPPEKKAAEETSDGDTDPEPDKKDDDKDAEAEESTDEAIVVPEAYRRTAINQGWTEEDIVEQFKANPELTLKTLGKIHDSTNNLNVKFAELGRKSMEGPVVVEKPAKEKSTDTKSAIDLSKLEETYKDDPIVDAFKAIAQTNEDLKTELDALKQEATELPKVSKAEQDAVLTEISGFFESDQVKFYEEFYGKSKGNDWGGLTQDQFNRRGTVTAVADQIAAGKVLQDGEITNAEALEAAHAIVSSDFLKEAVANDIKTKLKDREKGITFKPDSQASKEEEAGKPKTQADIIKKAQEKMASIGL